MGKTKKTTIEVTDEMDFAVTYAAAVMADEFFYQKNKPEIAEEHDDSWYELQEELRERMLSAAFVALADVDV